GELEHRRLKRFYVHMNKNALFVSQITKHQHRKHFVNKAHSRVPKLTSKPAERKAKARRAMTQKTAGSLQARPDVHKDIGSCAPRDHHQISHEQQQHVDIAAFVRNNKGDVAVENFARDLRTHVLERLHTGLGPTDEDYVPSHEDHAALRICHDCMYIHKQMLVNYTTYDM
ncbi:uncharacterized protein TRAVEDRAFT_77649, partial [Trametes versicolor FP-101664 SS1]|uniref:uncharacterized protein n=1 Tax=Trametes versicolor (strain FP-101664) TaxID=717944 RepID=UPI0004623086